jgi:uroporphyrinogen-III synthase
MRLIITRPEEDANLLADKLARLGHLGIIVPLLAIRPRADVALPNHPWQAICATSANALCAVPYSDALKAVTLYCVGPQSLAEARHQGFSRASAHGPDVNGLSAYIASHLKPERGPLLYLSGAEVSADLLGKLRSKGFTAHRAIVYDALPIAPIDLATELPKANGVLLYSPRSAQHWMTALNQLSLTELAAKIVHFCLSANVAAILPKHFLRSVAESPDELGMLTMLDRSTEAE